MEVAAHVRGVEVAEIAQQQRRGEFVARDVVGEHEHHVLVGRDREQPDPQRDLAFEIERVPGLGMQAAGERVAVDGLDREGNSDLGNLFCSAHVLHPHAVAFDEDGAQALVASEYVGDRVPQGIRVDGSVQVHRDGDVVGRAGSFQAVHEPQALLRIGQWCEGRVRWIDRTAGSERRPGRSGGRSISAVRGERDDLRMVEDRPDRQLHTELVTDAGEQLRGAERVPAEGEEVVVGAHRVEAQDVGVDAAQRPFGLGLRDAGRDHRREVRFGQRLAVELAVGGQRHLVENDERRGNHVPGQELGDETAGLDRFGHVLSDEITDELRGSGGIGAHHGRGAGDAGDAQQSGVDLTELDTESSDLDLVVDPAAVDEAAVLGPLHEIAGAVQAGVRTGGVRRVRIRDEPRGGEGGCVEISPDHARSGHVQLALGSGRHGGESRVEDVDAQRDGRRRPVSRRRRPPRRGRRRCTRWGRRS